MTDLDDAIARLAVELSVKRKERQANRYQDQQRLKAEAEGRVYRTHSQRRIDRRARAEEMAALYSTSMTLQQIGDKYGLTRERIRHILKKELGLTAKNGVTAARFAALRENRRRDHEARWMEKQGCTVAQWRSIPARARAAFMMQRSNARRYNEAWALSMWEWWELWRTSDRWEQRGRGRHVLGRLDRSKPWALGNVAVVPMAAILASRWKGGLQAVL